MNQKSIVAIMYDFDKTLSPKDMQEYAFIYIFSGIAIK